jgi:saccharopine dehydrogenase-like NADP-dependent oxidoreductase
MPEVSFRWEDLTPRQALAALLDNYDLVIDFAGPTQAARILPTKWADAEAKAAEKN